MEMSGSCTINAAPGQVWAALNDPEALAASIPGCQSLQKLSDTRFSAVVKTKIGPVNATFKGEVELTDIVEPVGYFLSGEGKGGAAGFAKGSARVGLSEAAGATELSYEATAKVGGKLAQLGARLVDGVAKKLTAEFFEAFKARVEGVDIQRETPEAQASLEEAGGKPGLLKRIVG